MRLLHAIHDFLPRHRAGSEIYAFELARELSKQHDVFILSAEYDPATAHGTLRWRSFEGLPVIEIVNNWEFERYEETYSSARINAQLQHVLNATRPDVVHVHNLLNLSFDLPRLARAQGASTVATLHDYTLVCASGGQRVHAAESHVCDVIDPGRCSRCVTQSPLHRQMAAGQITRRAGGRFLGRAALGLRSMAPAIAQRASGRISLPPIAPGDITRRTAYARHVFDSIDLFVAPSAALAQEYVRLGLPADRVEVSDYGFRAADEHDSSRTASHEYTRGKGFGAARSSTRPVRIGFVGTLVWHKGVHVLLDAARALRGDFEIHVHGDLSVFPDYSDRLRQMADGLTVEFHGGFDDTGRAAVYRALDVLVVPSLWPENSPLVIHEAFLHGVAVVGARVGGIPGLVTDGTNGLLYDAFSAEELGGVLQRFIDDPLLAERFSSNAPAVKTIAEDAREWGLRYAAVRGTHQPATLP